MGIRPWEVELLTVEQLDDAIESCRVHQQSARAAAAHSEE